MEVPSNAPTALALKYGQTSIVVSIDCDAYTGIKIWNEATAALTYPFSVDALESN